MRTHKTLIFVFAFLTLFQIEGCAAIYTSGTIDPTALTDQHPSPEPNLPAEFDTFSPPVDPNGVPANDSPAVAEWTRSAAPGESLVMTGENFSRYSNGDAGKDTRFLIFGQNDRATPIAKDGQILRLDRDRAAITLDESLPAPAMYLLWPRNDAGYGRPIAINRTEAWWLGPQQTTRGQSVSIFGRNLSHANGTAQAWVYLKPKTSNNTNGIWVAVSAVNPYKVTFTVPADLPDGDYEVWAHNGHGGHFGWSAPLTLTVNTRAAWNDREYNVKSFGARGDNAADDEAAIQAAVDAARRTPNSTVYFPSGTYLVSRGFHPPADVRWRGDGRERTVIKLHRDFIKSDVYDDRRYCLIFESAAARNIEIKDMTLDADNHLNGYLDTLVYLRGQSEIRFTNVALKAIGYKFFDFHLSSQIFLTDCEFIGTEGFLGGAKQVFVTNCNFYGTNDANTLLASWGADGLSVTNSTARDYNNTRADGWAQGRFVYGNGVWGSNRHIYLGDNKTYDLAVRPAFSNQTSGEQFLWEGNATVYSGAPSVNTTETFSLPDMASLDDANRYEAIIVKGRGQGQHRAIKSYDAQTHIITLVAPWRLTPDTGSAVIVAAVAEKIALYHNSLDGKSDYKSRETASSGIQPYGNSYDFIADGNRLTEVGTGLSSWATDEHEKIEPCYFNLYTNNSIDGVQIGALANVAYGQNIAGDPGASYTGNIFRRNTINNSQRSAFTLDGRGAPRGNQIEFTVIENNHVSETPTGINSFSRSADDATLANTIIQHNDFTHGAASAGDSSGLRLQNHTKTFLRDNVWTNFAAAYAGPPFDAPLMTPYRVLDLNTASDSVGAAPFTLPLRNGGASTLMWDATSNADWLRMSAPQGTIADQSGLANLTFSVNATALSPGAHTGALTIHAGAQKIVVTINLNVTTNVSQTPAPTPPPSPPPPSLPPDVGSTSNVCTVASSAPNTTTTPAGAGMPMAIEIENAGNNYTYTFANLQPGNAYTLCLQFSPSPPSASATTYLDVLINSVLVLARFDVNRETQDHASVMAFPIVANADGRITVDYLRPSQ